MANRSARRRPQSFTERLEARARKIAGSGKPERQRWSPLSIIRDEIAVLLEQIEAHRERETETLEELLEAECEIDTELMQMEQRVPRYSPYRFPEREKMLRRRDAIRAERRRLTGTQSELVRRMPFKLLKYLETWDGLT